MGIAQWMTIVQSLGRDVAQLIRAGLAAGGVSLAGVSLKGDGFHVHPEAGDLVGGFFGWNNGKLGESARELGRVHAAKDNDALFGLFAAQCEGIGLDPGCILVLELVDMRWSTTINAGRSRSSVKVRTTGLPVRSEARQSRWRRSSPG